jgi:hypothetical protein
MLTPTITFVTVSGLLCDKTIQLPVLDTLEDGTRIVFYDWKMYFISEIGHVLEHHDVSETVEQYIRMARQAKQMALEPVADSAEATRITQMLQQETLASDTVGAEGPWSGHHVLDAPTPEKMLTCECPDDEGLHRNTDDSAIVTAYWNNGYHQFRTFHYGSDAVYGTRLQGSDGQVYYLCMDNTDALEARRVTHGDMQLERLHQASAQQELHFLENNGATHCTNITLEVIMVFHSNKATELVRAFDGHRALQHLELITCFAEHGAEAYVTLASYHALDTVMDQWSDNPW